MVSSYACPTEANEFVLGTMEGKAVGKTYRVNANTM
jgi:hypothetical protein